MSRPKSIDRDRVLDVAEDIVVRRGAAELTIDAVAKGVGVTKGGVQSCFGTKENLIAAMLQRWGDAYEEAQRKVPKVGAADCTPVQRHIRVTARSDSLNARAAALLAAMLQSKDQLGWMRSWYAGHLAGFDVTTDEGRRARLAFLATEGAFMLRYFGLVDMSKSEWSDIFRDIERCAEPGDATPSAAPAPQSSPQVLRQTSPEEPRSLGARAS
jgi:AcrR family transcriptional regulator